MTRSTSPDHSHSVDPARAESSMSPAQARRLAELREENPERTYAPSYVHGISGMLEVEMRQPIPGSRSIACATIGITASGDDVGYALTNHRKQT